MNTPTLSKPTGVRYGVLGFACVLSMITYLDRVCFGAVAPDIQREFGLSETQKGWIFSAFALAYAAFEVPSGYLGDMFGAKRTLIRIVLWWSFFTVLTGLIYPIANVPWFAFTAMLVVRFLFGMGEAGAYPNIARAFHNWFPAQQRGFAKGAVWMAGRFAGGITPLIVFALIYKDSEGVTQWRHTFYIFGVLGVIWCVAFWWWYRDRPEDNPNVNEAERALIHGGHSHASGKTSVPWSKLFRDRNLWALCGMYFCAAYGWYFNITYLPGFLRDYFGVQRGELWSPQFWEASFLAGAPLLFGSVACLFGGLLTDASVRRTGDLRWGRRIFGVVGHVLCAGFYYLSIVAFQMDSKWGVVLCIAMASFCNDLTMGAAWASCLDIGKRYSGIVAGCMNTVGNLGGFAAGFLSGWIIDMSAGSLVKGDAGYLDATRSGWVTNLIVFGSVYVVAVVFWMFFDATKEVPQE